MLGAIMCCKHSLYGFFPFLSHLAFFGHFGAFVCLNFYLWSFLPIKIMVKTRFRGYMLHKCVLGCTYVLKRLVSIVFFNFVTNSDKFGIFWSFLGLFLPEFLFLDLYTNEYYG